MQNPVFFRAQHKWSSPVSHLRRAFFKWTLVGFSAVALLQSAHAQAIQQTPGHRPQQSAEQAFQTTSAHIQQDYLLGAGDSIKIFVYQSPDLSIETRLSESGSITYPLIGTVHLGGMTTAAAERRIAQKLKEGGFLIDPQVTITLNQIRGNQVTALGAFVKPGRYPLESTQTKLSDLVAEAGGISPGGSDTVIFAGTRNGKPVWQRIDIGDMFVNNQMQNDFVLEAGDTLYVDRYPVFYIYGEVQRPGSYRVERGLTIIKALVTGGGLTGRGTQNGIRLKRHNADGKLEESKPALDEAVQPDDVIYVREGLF